MNKTVATTSTTAATTAGATTVTNGVCAVLRANGDLICLSGFMLTTHQPAPVNGGSVHSTGPIPLVLTPGASAIGGTLTPNLPLPEGEPLVLRFEDGSEVEARVTSRGSGTYSIVQVGDVRAPDESEQQAQ